MRIHVHYWNQIRDARGVNEEFVTLDKQATMLDLLQRLGEFENMQSFLFDDAGKVSPWILIDRAGEMVRDPLLPLSDGDEVRLSTHISGG